MYFCSFNTATVLQAREAGNLSPNSTQWVRKQAELRRARHLQARRKTRNAEKRASELAHPVGMWYIYPVSCMCVKINHTHGTFLPFLTEYTSGKLGQYHV